MGPFRKEFIVTVAGVLIVSGTVLGGISLQKEITALQNKPVVLPVKQIVVVAPTNVPTATPEATLRTVRVVVPVVTKEVVK